MSSHSSVGDLKACSSHQSGSNPEISISSVVGTKPQTLLHSLLNPKILPVLQPSESESEASFQQSFEKDSGIYSFSSESGSGNYKTDTSKPKNPKLVTAISVIQEEMNILDVYRTNSLVLENFFRFLLKAKKSESFRHPLPELTESSIQLDHFISLKTARHLVTPENDEIFKELNAICCVAERECGKLYSSSIPTTTTVLDSISWKIEPVDRSGDNHFSIEASLLTLRLRRTEIIVDKIISLNFVKGTYDRSVLVSDYVTTVHEFREMTNIWKQLGKDPMNKNVLDLIPALSEVRHSFKDFQERIDSLETKIKELNEKNNHLIERLGEHDCKIKVLEEDKSKQSDQIGQLLEKNGVLEVRTHENSSRIQLSDKHIQLLTECKTTQGREIEELKQKNVDLESTVKELKYDQSQTDKNVQQIINQNIQNKIINNKDGRDSNWALMLCIPVCIALSASSLSISIYK